ncbi:MAG: cell shape determination protein CcmA [Parcubacteria group bacterium]|nr:cell shape determination protein CcmA [Parcubacteria group bacterium]|tara:strand:+ start:223 stop:657 length:435 start_codon:yes stop_codon:yes gene_type:complete
MFKEKEGDSVETMIGPSVHVEGNFVANGDIIVEGVVSGSIKTEKNLHIGKDAKVYAKISATNAMVAGEIQGNVKIKESLELTNTARVFGDIKTKTLTIAPGASVNGKCIAGEDKKTKLEKIDDKEKIVKQKIKEIPISTPVKVK